MKRTKFELTQYDCKLPFNFMKRIFRVKKDQMDPKVWTDSRETLDSVEGKVLRESGVILEERYCLIHNYSQHTRWD